MEFVATTSWADANTATPIADLRALQQLTAEYNTPKRLREAAEEIEKAMAEHWHRYHTIHLPGIKHNQRRRAAKLRMLRLGRKRRRGCHC